MGDIPCLIIISGNELAGNMDGIGDLYSVGYAIQPELSAREKSKLRDFVLSIKAGVSNYVNEIRQAGDVEIDISTLALQAVGGLKAICRTATSEDIDEDVKADILKFIDEKTIESTKWLELLRERAVKETV